MTLPTEHRLPPQGRVVADGRGQDPCARTAGAEAILPLIGIVTAFMAAPSLTADMQIEEILTALRSPRQSPYVESFIGSIRRERLDHVVIVNE